MEELAAFCGFDKGSPASTNNVCWNTQYVWHNHKPISSYLLIVVIVIVLQIFDTKLENLSADGDDPVTTRASTPFFTGIEALLQSPNDTSPVMATFECYSDNQDERTSGDYRTKMMTSSR